MSFSVTKNVSVVTDVMSLLSNLGFEPGVNETQLDLVIDQFDQWRNSATKGRNAGCMQCGLQIAA